MKFPFLILLFISVSFNASFASFKLDSSIGDQKKYLEGQAFFFQKRYKKAIDIFIELTERYPDHKKFQYYYSLSLISYLQFKIWLERAEVLYKFKRFNHALLFLSKAESIYPFGDSINNLKSEIKSVKNSHTPLEHLNKKEHKLFKDVVKRGTKKLKIGSNEAAFQLFSKALNLAPQSTTALEGYNEAQKRYLAGQYETKINIFLKQARNFNKVGKFIRALAKYKAVLRFDPANQESINEISKLKNNINIAKTLVAKKTLLKQYRNTGKKFIKEKKFNEGVEQYELGKSLSKNFINWDRLIKEAYLLQKIANEKEKQKLNQKIERNYNRGLAFIASKKYRYAITAFQQVVTDATKIQRTFMVEQAMDILKKITKALFKKDEEKVNRESPYYNLMQSLKVLGLKNIANKNFKLAGNYFDQIISIFPYNRFANQYLAVCQIKIDPQKKDRIMQDFIREAKESLVIKKRIKAERILDVLLFIDKNYKGVKKLQQLIGRNKQKVIGSSASKKQLNILWNQALIAQRQANRKKALRISRQILRLNPSHTNARSLLGRLESGNIIRRAPTSVPARAKKEYTKGILHYNTGALQLALNSFKTAVEIHPTYRKASIALHKCRKYLASR